MPHALIPLALGVGGSLLNKAIGGGGAKAQVPKDLQPMRQQQIGLLQYLLGFGPDPRQAMHPTAASVPQQRPSNTGTGNPGWGQWNNPSNPPQAQPSAGAVAPPNPWESILQLRQANAGGQPMAEGGMVHGPGGPTSDQVPAQLSNGEGVLTSAAVQALGGPQAVHLLNQLGIAHQMASQAPQHFAQGGMVYNPLGNGLTNNGGPPPVPWGQPPVKQQGPAGPPSAPTMTAGPGTTAPAAPAVPAQAPSMGNPVMPKSDAQTRLESFFGPLGVPTTPLQQQSSGGMSQFLASDPYKQAQTALNGILGNPGEGFRPDFERSLAAANQQGGRFGSANALLRSTALNDYNSKAIQAQLGAAQGIQGLGAQQSNDYTSAYNMGTAQANQAASGQQQAIQLLLNQLQTAQSATLGAPTTQQPSFLQDVTSGAGGLSQLLPWLQQQQTGASSQNINPYYHLPGFQTGSST